MSKNIFTQKSDFELILALKDHLLNLSDMISDVASGKRRSLREIPHKLRLLVADEGKGTQGGLLLYLFERFPNLQRIKWNGEEFTLKEFLNQRAGGINERFYNRAKFIKEYAQSDGGSHESVRRNEIQQALSMIFGVGKAERTDLEVGVILKYAAAVYDYGVRFLGELEENVKYERK